MTRWFSVLYFDDPEIQRLLDIVICLADPSEKNQAHVTLRGPFDSKHDAANFVEPMNGSDVSVVGVGVFFEGRQSTVFLECGSDLIRKNWFKRGLGYHPHITLYDGGDRIFAEKLLSVLRFHRLFFKIRAGDILAVPSVSGQKDMGLFFQVDAKFFRHITGREFDLKMLRTLEDWQRLSLIDRVCTFLVGIVQARPQSGGQSLSPSSDHSVRRRAVQA